MNIKYIEGDLFDAPANAILLHSCNCQGVWGSGVAKEFRHIFPEEFDLYYVYCKNNLSTRGESSYIIGKALIVNNVGCLFTSYGYGNKVSDPLTILRNTRNAIIDLILKTPSKEFHLPKINSGLFKVPWEETEKILLEFPEITWYVYTGIK